MTDASSGTQLEQVTCLRVCHAAVHPDSEDVTVILRDVVRRAATLAMATGIAAGLTLSTAGSASAASPDVLLSDDGIHFSTGLSDGLFDGLGLLIPGESMKSSLWIKNPTGDAAATRVSIGNLSVPSPAFGTGVSLTTVDYGGATTSTATLSELQRCAVIVPSQPMWAGSVLRIDFTVTMSDIRVRHGRPGRSRKPRFPRRDA